MADSGSSEVAVLLERVDRLERRCRRLLAVVACLGLLVFGGLAVGVRAEPEEDHSVVSAHMVEASWFVLKAADGKARAELVVDPQGGGKLRLFRADGNLAVELPADGRSFPLAARNHPSGR
jgi:hypothetical protein